MALPTDFANLTGWWKVDSETGLNDGDAVTTFTDRSGNSRNFTGSSTARPLYKTNIANGYPVLRFDGSNDQMGAAVAMSTFIAVGAGTIFVVAKPTPVETSSTYSTNADCLLVEPEGGMGLHVATSSERYAAANYPGGAQNYAVITASLSAAFHSFLWMHSGGSVYAGLDDARTASLTGTASGNSTLLAAAPLLGRNRTDGTAIFTAMDLAEVVIYSDAKDEATRMAVEGYLAGKYSLSVPYSGGTLIVF